MKAASSIADNPTNDPGLLGEGGTDLRSHGQGNPTIVTSSEQESLFDDNGSDNNSMDNRCHDHEHANEVEEPEPMPVPHQPPSVPDLKDEHSSATDSSMSLPTDTDTTTQDQDDDDDVEKILPLLPQSDFTATCRLAAKLGAAAMNTGSLAENVEGYLPKLMEVYGYYGFFSCSTLQIACNFERPDPETPGETIVRTQNIPIAFTNFQLTKLGLLSDLAKDLMDGKVSSIQQAHDRLDEIVLAPDPWGRWAIGVSFCLTGGAVPALLGGSWWDMVLGPLAGGIAYALILLFDAWPSRIHVWMNLVASFLCASLGFAVQLYWKPEVDPTIVTLSGIVVLLPSSSITLGINDLVSSHVISGLERLVKGMMIMLWLAVGYVLGMSLVNALAPEDTDWVSLLEQRQAAPTIPALWRLLFVPILCASIAVVFQMTGPDLMGAIVCMLVGYGTSYASVLVLDQPYLPSFLGSLAISTYANVWSRYHDRPNTIILFPAFQLVVAGIVGFMGLTEIIEGGGSSSEEGGNQVLHMLLVAGIVVIGFLVGRTLVRPCTTI